MVAPQRHCSGVAVERTAALCPQTCGFPWAVMLSDGIWVEGLSDLWLTPQSAAFHYSSTQQGGFLLCPLSCLKCFVGFSLLSINAWMTYKTSSNFSWWQICWFITRCIQMLTLGLSNRGDQFLKWKFLGGFILDTQIDQQIPRRVESIQIWLCTHYASLPFRMLCSVAPPV